MKNNQSGVIRIFAVILITMLIVAVLISLFLPAKIEKEPIFLDKSPIGFSILVDFIKESGYKTKTANKLPETQNNILFIDGLDLSEQQQKNIQDKVSMGNTVILLNTRSIKQTEKNISTITIQPVNGDTLSVSNEYATDIKSLNVRYQLQVFDKSDSFNKVLTVQGVQTEQSQEPLEPESFAMILEQKISKGKIFYLAGNELFNNEWLKEIEYAVLIKNLCELPESQNAYFITLPDDIPRTGTAPLSVLLNKSILFVSLNSIAAILLVLFSISVRFGNAVKINPNSKRKITEHIEAVGGFWKNHKAASLVEKIQAQYFSRLLQNSKNAAEYAKYSGTEKITDNETNDLLSKNLQRQKIMDEKLKRRI